MRGLGAGVVDYQHLEGVVVGGAGQGLELFQQAGGIQGAGEELLAAGAHGCQAGRCIGLLMAEEDDRQLLLQPLLGFPRQPQTLAGAGEIHFQDDGRRMPFGHGRAEGTGAVEALGVEAEELQLLDQAPGALLALQCQVHRLAQGRQEGLLELVAVAQSGAREALHQQAELGDQVAGQPPAILLHTAQAVADGDRQTAMLGLFEAFGIALQVEAGLGQLGHAGQAPLAALQALPDLQHMPGLVDDALGEVILEAVAARIFVLGHGPAS
ncbi:hypothetical protein D3C84_364280 [compost metagenome]